MRQVGLYISFLTLGFFGHSQNLKTNSDKKSILIGEPFTITYRVKTVKGDSIFFQPKSGEIPSEITTSSTLRKEGTPFEIIDEFDDTTIVSKSSLLWLGTYVVTVWDSGEFVIPGPDIIIADSTFQFPELKVKASLVAPKKDIDIYDIHENYTDIPDEPFAIVPFLKKWWWIILILLLILGYYLYKKRKPVEEEEQRHVSLKQRTLIAIEALEKEKMWERGKLKEHYVELSYILRSYLTRRYEISLLERTTSQTKLLLKENGLNDDTIDTIVQILNQSDMVKFAKSKPDLVAILRISTLAKQIVAETSPLEIEDAE